MTKFKNLLLITFLIISFYKSANAQFVIYDTTQVGKYDMGKLWTLDDFPKEYLKEKYDLTVSDTWLEKVRLSALKFTTWCSSSFVSEDGLIMTNHHCIDFVEDKIEQAGENIQKNGFYAATLNDERKMEGIFVDQLVFMEDITAKINEKVGIDGKSKTDVLKEIKADYDKETGLNCVLVPYYSGAKYSVYGYKRYEDVRAVLFNESSTGLYGGDWDNFTYPRYDADFAFLRVYDETGKPLKTDNFFKFSKNGPQLNEPIFAVGNPGTTRRLKTVAQIEYMRDFDSRNSAFMYDRLMKAYYQTMDLYPEETDKLLDEMSAISNTAKVVIGEYNSIKNPYLLIRKKSFEKEFRSLITKDKTLNEKYGHLWQSIEDLQKELSTFENLRLGYTLSTRGINTEVFNRGLKIYNLAVKLKKDGVTTLTDSLKKYIENSVDKIYENGKRKFDFKKKNETYSETFEMKKLAVQLDLIKLSLGKDNNFVKMLSNNLDGEEAAKYLLNKTVVLDKERIKKMFIEGYNIILNSNDPVINYIASTRNKLEEYTKRWNEICETEDVLENQLGEALYAVYGSKIPPDATFTLRVNDGVVKGYEYNGTIAPPFTTFYGMFDRYYSFNKKAPWDLPERWSKPNPNLDLSTIFNFVSTNDITGGSSGSPIINKDAEIVGVAFDGDIESLAGDFLFDEQSNRCVSVSSQAILEIVGDIVGAERIRQELINGKIVK